MLSNYGARLELGCFDLGTKAAKESYGKAANPSGLVSFK